MDQRELNKFIDPIRPNSLIKFSPLKCRKTSPKTHFTSPNQTRWPSSPYNIKEQQHQQYDQHNPKKPLFTWNSTKHTSITESPPKILTFAEPIFEKENFGAHFLSSFFFVWFEFWILWYMKKSLQPFFP